MTSGTFLRLLISLIIHNLYLYSAIEISRIFVFGRTVKIIIWYNSKPD